MDSMIENFKKKMAPLALREGVEFKQCASVHFQLKSIFLVNVYPTKQTFYVQGSNHKLKYYDLNQLIQVSKGGRDLHTEENKTKRRPQRMKKAKIALWEKSKECFFCGFTIETFDDASVEHKVPLSKGGSNRRDNLSLSHKACNGTRGSSLSVLRSSL